MFGRPFWLPAGQNIRSAGGAPYGRRILVPDLDLGGLQSAIQSFILFPSNRTGARAYQSKERNKWS